MKFVEIHSQAWGDAAETLVASELATIYQLVKARPATRCYQQVEAEAKSERILDKEKEVPAT